MPADAPQFLIGLSGWNYDDWKRHFYAGVKRADWLAHYATVFDTVEVNATFYREQTPETLAAWRDGTPDGFRFAVKGHKYVTHMKRLLNPETTVPRHAPIPQVLGPKLSAMLWQLPGHCKATPERLDHFCAELRTHFPHVPQVMELRHVSWFTDEVAAILDAHGVATCISDAADWPRWDNITANLAYLRLHGRPRTYYSPYSDAFLDELADHVRAWTKAGTAVHIYFDNTADGQAPKDALRLRGRL